MREESRLDRQDGTVELRVRVERGGVVETLRVVCDEALVPRGIYAAQQGRDGWRTLEALPKRDGGWLAVRVSAPDGARRRWDLDLPREIAVDYPSAAVERLAADRLRLAPGEAREVAVLRVMPGSLEPAAATRWYAREAGSP